MNSWQLDLEATLLHLLLINDYEPLSESEEGSAKFLLALISCQLKDVDCSYYAIELE